MSSLFDFEIICDDNGVVRHVPESITTVNIGDVLEYKTKPQIDFLIDGVRYWGVQLKNIKSINA